MDRGTLAYYDFHAEEITARYESVAGGVDVHAVEPSARLRQHAIDRIESILNADRKVATYKLALIRALCDVVLTAWSQAQWEPNGKVSVALEEVTRRWIWYYWPFVESRQMMPQINGEARGAKPSTFRAVLGELEGTTACRPKPRSSRGRPPQKSRTPSSGGPVHFAGGALGAREFDFDAATRRILIDAVRERLPGGQEVLFPDRRTPAQHLQTARGSRLTPAPPAQFV